MILVDHEIESLVASREVGVDPFTPAHVNPTSLDLTLGDDFCWYTDQPLAIDPAVPPTLTFALGKARMEKYTLPPHGFVLGTTAEAITLPPHIVATVEGKSSLARLGLVIHATGGFVDCGFSGAITLEMGNLNCRPIVLHAGMRIAQLVFRKTSPARVPYSHRPDAKYRDQRGTTPSRYRLGTVRPSLRGREKFK